MSVPHHHDSVAAPPKPPSDDKKKGKNTPIKISINDIRNIFRCRSCVRYVDNTTNVLPDAITTDPSIGA